eukprot:CAMPEP_0170459604 /NCGR_PEP_ID=MMETSP0123-20130129/6238_1 /TAXON_ID=182087 /ORGANISM="Favella ehrenbergii, Strain Fehren 1" /LENGTH=274 /DNA_ID=CAMNT_0010724247 /DNA_START=539 /DNA_END=1364 /DNA_ORIENTATION=+
MAAKVLDSLHLVRLVSDGNLIGLHRFLDLFAYLAEDCVNTSGANTSLSRLLDSLNQRVVAWVESHSEGAIGHQTLDMRAIINLHYIVLTQNSLVTDIGRPMGRAMIETGTSREGNASVEAASLDQAAIGLFDLVGDVHDFHAGADEALGVLAHLTMDFSSTSQLLIIRLEELLFCAKFSTANSVVIMVIIVLHYLTSGEVAIGILLRDRHRVVDGLLPGAGCPAAEEAEARVVLLALARIAPPFFFFFLFFFLGAPSSPPSAALPSSPSGAAAA